MNPNSRNLLTVVLFFLLLIAVSWFVYNHYQHLQTPQTTQQSPQVAPPALSIGTRTKDSNCVVQGPLPDKQCTPGAIFEQATVKEICVSGYTKTVRNVPQSLKKQVYAEYGVTHRVKGQYEVDHLVPLELGGSNDIANLFPESAEPRPGFHEKDKVENYLHEQVCSGRVDLRKAQAIIANNWLVVWKGMN